MFLDLETQLQKGNSRVCLRGRSGVGSAADDEGKAEKQLCTVAASNVIRNFSFMPDNEVVMAQHRHCLETVYQCINDHMTGKEKYCVLLPHKECFRFLFLGLRTLQWSN
ncbi:hypothetical protein F2Q70_00043546 [Brassica cretica]|uniref:SWI/SNF-like complex subunit BAF250 C-terminal domain-containing protein n=1 Tax=Brassica cretica TaxID=69181 RepID=A0A8S9KQE9_BRACR|nr:hypothetical protein F2Q70_00043546 [Brassica cretica]KAF2609233.1 hypothetical protein F2Q68_00044551 [Brassica cretica]